MLSIWKHISDISKLLKTCKNNGLKYQCLSWGTLYKKNAWIETTNICKFAGNKCLPSKKKSNLATLFQYNSKSGTSKSKNGNYNRISDRNKNRNNICISWYAVILFL